MSLTHCFQFVFSVG